MMLRFRIIYAISLGLAPFAEGQTVRRALPVSPTPTPEQVLRALPVNPTNASQAPGANSILNQGLGNRPAPQPPPQAPQKSSGASAEPDSNIGEQARRDEIRLGPGSHADRTNTQDPAKAQLAVANGLYLRKVYDLASAEYEKYLEEFPFDDGRAAALYRLADCYTSLHQEAAALNTYHLLISEVGSGELVGSAAFRLATREFDQRSYASAAPLFQKAYENARSPEIKITARYYQAKCLELTNQKMEARAAYEDVSKIKDKNPYWDAACLSLAYLALENNQKQEAFDRFTALAHDSTKPAVQAEAYTRAGIVASDLKQKDKAEESFKAAVELAGEGKWKEVAQLELMKLEYDSDKFSQVLDSYTKNASNLSADTAPSVLLIAANSYRQMGKFPKALDLYNQLIRQFSTTAEAAEARYQRLVTLDSVKSPNLVAEVDAFLATYPSRDRADKARLLKAQALVQQNHFEAAARVYLDLTNSSLPEAYKADCYYAAAYSLSQVNDNRGAIVAFSGLIDRYPKYKLIPQALLKRGLLFQQAKDYPAAIGDFSRLISDYPQSPETETAMLQKGLTLGQEQDYPQMVAIFRDLLNKYPQTPGAAQANYWIGWAAFEAKDYAGAVQPFVEARKLNPAEYGEKATIRLIYCYQSLKDRDKTVQELDSWLQGDPHRATDFLETCRWLGLSFYDDKNYTEAARYLELLTKNSPPEAIDRGTWLAEGITDLKVGKFKEAIANLQTCLGLVTDPADRAVGLLQLGRAQLGAQLPDDALKSAQAALSLEPEGRLNADGRMLIGDIESSRRNYEDAAKSYLSVAVLYEDPEVTPNALEQAYQAFSKAGNQLQASKTLSELKSRFPNYQVKEPAAG